ncbi:prepilin peptidase [Candidatus Microgenomates bacterium]|nr:prepilin peptidase [Candidatus Microgenomates bacterium]
MNVLIDRLATNQSIVSPASHCDRCKKRLEWRDLIPVISFVILRGRCRFCRSPISWQYPMVELLTGLLFTFSIFNFQFLIFNENFKFQILNLLFTLYIVSSFIVIFFADLKYGIIPDKIIYPAIVVSFIFLAFSNSFTSGESLRATPEVFNALFAALGAFLFFMIIFLLTRGRGMGFGDVKFSFLLGLIFGFPKIVAVLYIAFLTGAAFSVILMILNKKKPKDAIAFGPFLVVGALSVLFFWDFLYSRVLLNIWFLPAVLP